VLSRSKKPNNKPRELAQNHLQTSTNVKHQQAKKKQQEGKEVFLVNEESGSFFNFLKQFIKLTSFTV